MIIRPIGFSKFTYLKDLVRFVLVRTKPPTMQISIEF